MDTNVFFMLPILRWFVFVFCFCLLVCFLFCLPFDATTSRKVYHPARYLTLLHACLATISRLALPLCLFFAMFIEGDVSFPFYRFMAFFLSVLFFFHFNIICFPRQFNLFSLAIYLIFPGNLTYFPQQFNLFSSAKQVNFPPCLPIGVQGLVMMGGRIGGDKNENSLWECFWARFHRELSYGFTVFVIGCGLPLSLVSRRRLCLCEP